MKGLYSYDVFDSPAFIQAKKIETRIAKHDKRMRAKNDKKAEAYRIEAQKQIEMQ